VSIHRGDTLASNVTANGSNYSIDTFIDGQRIWDYSIKFARWQHHAVECLEPHVAIAVKRVKSCCVNYTSVSHSD